MKKLLMFLVVFFGLASSTQAGVLQMGIYSGGGVGAVQGNLQAFKPNKTLAPIIKDMHKNKTFVLREYVQYHDGASFQNEFAWVENRLELAKMSNSRLELVIRYQPKQFSKKSVQQYRKFVKALVNRFDPQISAFVIGNEINQKGSKFASDGDYPGVVKATQQGVKIAQRTTKKPVGVSLAASPKSFFKQHGYKADFVSINLYPGTWQNFSNGINKTNLKSQLKKQLQTLRKDMNNHGLKKAFIVVGETGFPNTQKRTQKEQALYLKTFFGFTKKHAKQFDIRGLRWFSLYDVDSKSKHMEYRYGLLKSNLQPKQAFGIFCNFVQLSS